jgi:hypothetical protein
MCFCLSVYLSLRFYVLLSFCLSVFLSLCPSVFLFICLADPCNCDRSCLVNNNNEGRDLHV